MESEENIEQIQQIIDMLLAQGKLIQVGVNEAGEPIYNHIDNIKFN